VFWCAGSLAMLTSRKDRPPDWMSLLPFAMVVLAQTWAILLLSMEFPYRQALPLCENDRLVRIEDHTVLRVSPDIANYISRLHEILAHQGFRAGDPVIDLTGRSPTTLHLVQAKAVGLAWLCGGYRGSEAMVAAALNRVPAETLRQAWVLTEPDGLRRISSDLLHHYALDLSRDYELVGSLESPVADYSKTSMQHLFRPKPRVASRGN
jgi:hypothetical protein